MDGDMTHLSWVEKMRVSLLSDDENLTGNYKTLQHVVSWSSCFLTAAAVWELNTKRKILWNWSRGVYNTKTLDCCCVPFRFSFHFMLYSEILSVQLINLCQQMKICSFLPLTAFIVPCVCYLILYLFLRLAERSAEKFINSWLLAVCDFDLLKC